MAVPMHEREYTGMDEILCQAEVVRMRNRIPSQFFVSSCSMAQQNALKYTAIAPQVAERELAATLQQLVPLRFSAQLVRHLAGEKRPSASSAAFLWMDSWQTFDFFQ